MLHVLLFIAYYTYREICTCQTQQLIFCLEYGECIITCMTRPACLQVSFTETGLIPTVYHTFYLHRQNDWDHVSAISLANDIPDNSPIFAGSIMLILIKNMEPEL